MADLEEEEEACDEGTLAEYMERVEEQELEADMVLGGDEGKECTYKQGYMKRQAVFSCLTCTPNGNAGFCTACSLACHDGHDVVELWTRRHFRCDCGNSKFGQSICKLQADKEIENAENTYNQNYKGVYCTCHRAYPDPDGEAFGEMLQCCICEDWFHELHLGLPSSLQFPRDEEGEPVFDELICSSCLPLCSFLLKYPDDVVAPAAVPVESTDPVGDVKPAGIENGKHAPFKPDGAQESGIASAGDSAVHELVSSTELKPDGAQENGISSAGDSAVHELVSSTELKPDGAQANAIASAGDSAVYELVSSTELKPDGAQANGIASAGDSAVCEHSNGAKEDCEAKFENGSVNDANIAHEVVNGDAFNAHPCELEKRNSSAVIRSGQAVFLLKSWRTQLCRCPSCLRMYEERRLGFLLDSDDSLEAYEDSAKRKRQESRAQVEAADLMKGLGHVQQIELLHGFNDMTSQLKDFLAPFGVHGRTVTSADIQEFFATLNEKKRRLN